MMTFKQFIKRELRHNTFSTLSSFVYGIMPWALVVLLSSVVTTTTDSFYTAQAGIFLILLAVCSISTYDTLKRRYRIYVLEEKIRHVNLEHWDGRH